VCRIYLDENHGFDQRKAPNSKSAFSTQVKAYIYFNFEFEYRKHCTMKGVRIDSQEMPKVLKEMTCVSERNPKTTRTHLLLFSQSLNICR
jgi:hypothetical protein